MIPSTEQLLQEIVKQLSAFEVVEAIGRSGSEKAIPAAGEGDIDLFIYCREIPDLVNRQAIFNHSNGLLPAVQSNVFQGGHWGVGDFILLNGVETWLMYFTTAETAREVDAILQGEYLERLDNYYYPTGRCAMLQEIQVFYDKTGFFGSIKDRLSCYPDSLAQKLMEYHLEQLADREDLLRAVSRKDLLFYHFALDLALDHFLQVLFSLNRVYFPSRKRTMEWIDRFQLKPENCAERLLAVLRLGAISDGVVSSYAEWNQLVDALRQLVSEH